VGGGRPSTRGSRAGSAYPTRDSSDERRRGRQKRPGSVTESMTWWRTSSGTPGALQLHGPLAWSTGRARRRPSSPVDSVHLRQRRGRRLQDTFHRNSYGSAWGALSPWGANWTAASPRLDLADPRDHPTEKRARSGLPSGRAGRRRTEAVALMDARSPASPGPADRDRKIHPGKKDRPSLGRKGNDVCSNKASQIIFVPSPPRWPVASRFLVPTISRRLSHVFAQSGGGDGAWQIRFPGPIGPSPDDRGAGEGPARTPGPVPPGLRRVGLPCRDTDSAGQALPKGRTAQSGTPDSLKFRPAWSERR